MDDNPKMSVDFEYVELDVTSELFEIYISTTSSARDHAAVCSDMTCDRCVQRHITSDDFDTCDPK